MTNILRARRIVSAGVVCFVLAAAGCGKDDQSTTAPSSSTTTTVFASTLSVNTSAARAFRASQAGTVTVTLTALGTVLPVGLGLGVPSTGVANCTLTTSVLTTAGTAPQITAAVDAGAYCAAVFDVGNLTNTVGFELSIVHP